jgi:UDP-2,3-diacylglucosamine hydrolase
MTVARDSQAEPSSNSTNGPFDYFISDLHLSAEEPALCELFFEFLRTHGPRMRSLAILGDFFDAWIGDDAAPPASPAPVANATPAANEDAFTAQIALALAALADTGVQIAFQHGNRDFLLGAQFAQRCKMQLWPELYLGFHNLAICHGDHLCTQDVAYLAFRAQVRAPAWQQQFLAQPIAARRAFAAKARMQSRLHQNEQPSVISDVDPQTVSALFQHQPARTLLHGHTHRPGVFCLPWQTSQQESCLPWQTSPQGSSAGANLQRIVLGDWRPDQPSWLALNGYAAELVAHGGVTHFRLAGEH